MGIENGNAFFEELGDFLKPAVLSKDVENNGKTATFYFRELNGEEGTMIFSGFTSSDSEKKDESVRQLRNRCIAAGLCDKDGNRVMNEKQAGKLPLSLANKLHTIVMEHNGMGVKDKEPKNE